MPYSRFHPATILIVGALLGSLLGTADARTAFSQSMSLPSPTASGVEMTPEQTRQSVQWLSDQLMIYVPRKMDGDDDWGETKKVWAGVKVRRNGWELKTNRRWKELRHGRWVRYEIELPARAIPVEGESLPLGKGLASGLADGLAVGLGNGLASVANPAAADGIEIHSVTAVTSATGDRRWKVDASLATPATFAVRVERWNLGAKWYSVEIAGKMKLSLRTTLTMALQADFAEVPPAMQLDVDIETAALAVSRFEVERISKLGGDAAEEIGDLAENTIGKVWIRKENGRLDKRLNKAINENHDSLRWSMADWLAQLAK